MQNNERCINIFSATYRFYEIYSLILLEILNRAETIMKTGRS